MPIIGCTKENNCKKDAFLKARQFQTEHTAENPHKQGESTDPKKISETTVSSGVNVTANLPGNSDITHHTSKTKYLDKRAVALEKPVAVAQKDLVEIPQVTTTAPETLVQTRQADVSELFVDGQETRLENQRAPREIPDSEFRESQDMI